MPSTRSGEVPSALHRGVEGFPTASATKAAQTITHVGELRVDTGDEREVAPRRDDIARSVEQVGDHVPLAHMVVLGLLRDRHALLHHTQSAHEIALIGQSTRRNDPPLGHQLRLGRRLAQFAPQLFDLVVAVQRPITVGQHGVMGNGAVEAPGQLEFGCGLAPLSEPIERQPGEFVTEREVGDVAQHWAHHAVRIAEATTVERIGGRRESFLVAGHPCRLDLGRQIVGDLGRDLLRTTTAASLLAHRPLRGLLGHLTQRAFVDPLVALPLGTLDRFGALDPLATTFAYLCGALLGGRQRALDPTRRHPAATPIGGTRPTRSPALTIAIAPETTSAAAALTLAVAPVARRTAGTTVDRPSTGAACTRTAPPDRARIAVATRATIVGVAVTAGATIAHRPSRSTALSVAVEGPRTAPTYAGRPRRTARTTPLAAVTTAVTPTALATACPTGTGRTAAGTAGAASLSTIIVAT